MKRTFFLTAFVLINIFIVSAQKTEFYNLKVKTIQGKEMKLKEFKGKVVLVVNTASKCGLTPQYEGLEELYKTFKDKGFVVLGFPCNQFLGQEPGTAEEIQKFCTTKYNITFPLFEKIEVNGDNAHPLYQYLKSYLPLETEKNDIRWNFEKFLIDKAGKPVKRYSPKTKPAELINDIEELLK
ncbi:MAG: glutathione peroxidase [Paludibacter sp.]|nr:glutathione peroxidase [Paludibacter sp.]